MSRKTLLIGCGGSGITTLKRFNEMLAGNRQWRDRLWEEVSYLVVDTNVDETKDFIDTVEMQLGRAKKPIVKLAQIARGYDTLGEIIAPNFEDENDLEKAELLRPYWWYSPDGEPYRAHRRRHIEKGAGQCCPISYMTMWKYLPQLKRDLDDLFAKICKNNIGANNPLRDLRVYIVAGLAGGTGRGCWNLIAFAVRQYLKQNFKKDIAPIGIFFDASCYPNKEIQKDPDQVHSMRVNSLTGISELDAWIRLGGNNQDYYYTLPQLTNPREAAAIEVNPKKKPFDSSEKAPVEAAYLIFGKSGRSVLDRNTQYHEMVAAALYSMVVGARYIDPGEINRVHDYGSLASASFEVETVKLRAYFESMLRAAAIRDMIADVGADDAKISELLGTGKNASNENSFFYRTGLDLSQSFDPTSFTPPEETVEGATILQRIISKVRAYRPNVVKEFVSIIQKQDVKAGWAFAEKKFGEFRGKAFVGAAVGGIPDSEIQKAVDEAFAEVELDDISASLTSLMTNIYYPGGRSDTQSIGRLLAATNVLATPRLSRQAPQGIFDKSIANLGNKDGIVCGKFKYTTSKSVRDIFKKVYDDAAKKNFFEFKPFNKTDLNTLRSSFALHINLLIYFRVCSLVAEKYNKAIDAIDQIRESVGLIEESLKSVAKTFGRSARVDCGVTNPSETVYDKLFVRPDIESVKRAIPEANSTELCYRRLLKPIMSEDDIKSLLLGNGKENPSASIDRRAIKDVMSREIVRLIQNAGKVKVRDELPSLKAIFTELFKSNVILERDFMDRNFSFEGVLRNNVEWWDKVLVANVGDLDEFDKLTDRLRVYLGVDREMLYDEDSTDPIPHIPVDKLLKSILISMVGTCKPWIQLHDDINRVPGDYCVTLALVPMEIDNVQAYEDAIEAAHPTQFPKIIHRGTTSSGKYELPYDRIVVFASQGVPVDRDNKGCSAIERISSVDYWKEDAEVKKTLALAESTDGMSFFEEDEGKCRERDIGLGYTNPVYVTEPTISNLRWKPWAPRETISEARRREKDVCRALLYAFLGNGLAEDELDIGGIATELSWPLPLLRMGKGEVFTFTRLPLEWKVASSKSEKTGGRRAAKRAWNGGDNLAVSIDNVFKFLLGKGRPGEEGARLAASVKKGGEILSQLLKEVQTFEDNVEKELTSANRRKLVEALQNWLDECKRNATKDDVAYWEKLIDVSAAE